MRLPTWLSPGYLPAYGIMAFLVLGGVGAVVYNARHPRPLVYHPPSQPPEWRCVDQRTGGPICYRALPPAAKRTD